MQVGVKHAASLAAFSVVVGTVLGIRLSRVCALLFALPPPPRPGGGAGRPGPLRGDPPRAHAGPGDRSRPDAARSGHLHCAALRCCPACCCRDAGVLGPGVLGAGLLRAGSSALPVCGAWPGPVRWAAQTGGRHGPPGTGPPQRGAARALAGRHGPAGHWPHWSALVGRHGTGRHWLVVTVPAGTDWPSLAGCHRGRASLAGRHRADRHRPGWPWSAATGRLAWSAATGRLALIRQDPYARLTCPDRPADLPGRAALSRRENLGFACYVWDPATAADAAGVVQGRRAGGRSAFLVLGVCPARAVSPAGPAPGARPPAGVRVGLRAAPRGWARGRPGGCGGLPRLGPRGRPDGCGRRPGWACDGAAGGPAGGPSDGLQAVPLMACGRLQGGLRAAPGSLRPRHPGGLRAAQAGLRGPGRCGPAGPRVGLAGPPQVGLRGCPGWACGPHSGWCLRGGTLGGPRARTPVRSAVVRGTRLRCLACAARSLPFPPAGFTGREGLRPAARLRLPAARSWS